MAKLKPCSTCQKEIASLKRKKKVIEQELIQIGENEETKKDMDETKKQWLQLKEYDKKIEEAKNESDVS